VIEAGLLLKSRMSRVVGDLACLGWTVHFSVDLSLYLDRQTMVI